MITAILLTTTVYLFWLAFCMHTKNLASSLLFKFIPFVLGVSVLVVLGKILGLLVL